MAPLTFLALGCILGAIEFLSEEDGMAIDPGRSAAILAAITRLNNASLIQDPVQREALAQAVLLVDADSADDMQDATIEQVLAELDQLLGSGFVTAGRRTVRGWPAASVIALA